MLEIGQVNRNSGCALGHVPDDIFIDYYRSHDVTGHAGATRLLDYSSRHNSNSQRKVSTLGDSHTPGFHRAATQGVRVFLYVFIIILIISIYMLRYFRGFSCIFMYFRGFGMYFDVF